MVRVKRPLANAEEPTNKSVKLLPATEVVFTTNDLLLNIIVYTETEAVFDLKLVNKYLYNLFKCDHTTIQKKLNDYKCLSAKDIVSHWINNDTYKKRMDSCKELVLKYGLKCASQLGNVWFFRYIYEHKELIPRKAWTIDIKVLETLMKTAAKHGKIHVLYYFINLPNVFAKMTKFSLYTIMEINKCVLFHSNDDVHFIKALVDHKVFNLYNDETVLGEVAVALNKECFKYLIENKLVPVTSMALMHATRFCPDPYPFVDILLYHVTPTYGEQTKLCCYAVERDNISLLKLYRQHGIEWDAKSCTTAASYGHIDLLKHLHENGCPWNAKTFEAAVVNDQIACLQYLYENGCLWYNNIVSVAAKGHPGCLEYLIKCGMPLHERQMYEAASCNSLPCMLLLYSNGSGWHNETTIAIRYYKNNECLEFVLQNQGPVHPQTALYIIACQNLEALELLRRSCTTVPKEASYVAAASGNLEILEYLIENKFPIHENILFAVASKGDLSYTREILNDECDWQKFFDRPSVDKMVTCFDFLWKKGFRHPDFMKVAAKFANYGVLKYCYENGIPWHPETTLELVKVNATKILDFVLRLGCPWHPDTLAAMFIHGNETTIQYGISYCLRQFPHLV